MILKKKGLQLCYTEISVFVLTFLIHVFFMWRIGAPQFVDEYRTFLTGEFLAGRYDLSLLHAYEEANIYYGFGQVLFYIPFFWIFESMDAVFKAALILNGIVMSLVPVLALKIFRMLLPGYSEFSKAGMAFSIGMFSPLIYASKTVTNETFLLFFPVLILYLIVVLSMNEDKKRKIILSALLGLCAAWMYTLNARGLAVAFSVFICVAYMEIIKKEKKISILSYMISSIVVYVINHFMNAYIVRVFHQPFSGAGVRNNDINLLNRIKQLHFDGFFTAVSTWSGNWFYIVAVSGGLLALLIAVMVKHKKNDTERNIFLFALTNTLMTCGMLFGINYNTYRNPKAAKIDRYMYGRYYDLLIPVILIVGMYFLVKFAGLLKTYLVTMLLIICTGALGTICFADVLLRTGSKGIRILNIGTLTAFLDDSFASNPSRIHFLSISIAVLVIFTILTLSVKMKKPLIAAVLLSGCFLFATTHVMANCKQASCGNAEGLESYRNMFSDYQKMDESYKTIYLLYEKGLPRGVNLQYALRGFKVAQIDMGSDYITGLDMIEKNSFILSSKETMLDLMWEECKFICEESGLFLYAYGQELIESLNMEEGIRDTISLQLLLLKSDEGLALAIENGARSYGPYVYLDAGTYRAEIRGEYLETASVQVTKNAAVDLIESSIVEQSQERILVSFSDAVDMNNVEILVSNDSRTYMIIDEILIFDEKEELIFTASANELATTGKACVISGEDVICLQPVFLDKGIYLVTIEGVNVKDLQFVIDNLPGGELREIESAADHIVYELDCKEAIKYPDFLIESLSDSEKCIEDIAITRKR